MINGVACQDYIGHFSTAAFQAGVNIIGKVEQADAFGIPAWRVNRDWFAPNCRFIQASSPIEWPLERVNADVVYGNPPCSAFSQLMQDPRNFDRGLAGIGGKQNQCMYDLVEYGGRLNATVITFESVRNAGINGRRLMYALHDRLEAMTGHQYHLTLVFLNALSVGGYQNRARFFWVASRLGPVSFPEPEHGVRWVSDVIGHLIDQVSDNWQSPFSRAMTPRARRLEALAAFHWPEGQMSDQAFAEAQKLGYTGDVGRSDSIRSAYTARRWKWNEPGRVITGGFMDECVHPVAHRMFTHVEAATLMGLPPEYDLSGIVMAKSKGRPWHGKSTPVQSARFIMDGIVNHIEHGDKDLPSVPKPIESRPRTYVLDVSNAWQQIKAKIDAVQPSLWAEAK
jgi:site-specific DNA-cytosine methylase